MKSRHQRKSNKKSNKSNKSRKNFKGGRTDIVSPEIRYTKGNNTPIKLTCPKCNGIKFIVKTLTMGTKTKSFFNLEILDNRFKIFQCAGCGFAQMFSNEITCNNGDCDPNMF
jgi:predicted nucleic-acid-binding Zn-ribbon protein